MKFSRIGRQSLLALVLLASTLSSVVADAQAFIQRVPSDSLAYFSWAGTDENQRGYQGSHLQSVIDASSFKAVITRLLPQVLDKIAQKERGFAQARPMIEMVGKLIWKRKFAIILHDVEKGNGRMGPLPRFALLVQGGDDVAGLKALIVAMSQQMPKALRAKLLIHLDRGLLLVAFGDFNAADLAVLKGEKLGGVGDPNGLVKNAQQMLYLNLAKSYQLLMKMEPSTAHDREFKIVNRLFALDQLKSLTLSSGFKNKQWVSKGFLKVPRSHRGILNIFGAFRNKSLLKSVPASAERVIGFSLNLSQLKTEVDRIVALMGPYDRAEYQSGKKKLEKLLALDLEKDIISPLGTDWVLYTDKHVGGTGMVSVVGVHALADAKAAKAGLYRLSQAIEKIISREIRNPEVHLRFKDATYDGIKVRYLATPGVSPCWSIVDQKLFVGLYPQQVVGAVRYHQRGGKRLAHHPGFNAAIATTGANQSAAFSWYNLPQAVNHGYSGAVFVDRLLMGVADIFGLEAPCFVVPPLYKIRDHLAPVSFAGFENPAGLGFDSAEAFPGSIFLGQPMDLAGLQQQALMVGLLMPALSTARQVAMKLENINSMKVILVGMHAYASTHKGQFPSDPLALLLSVEGPEAFFSLEDSFTRPAHWQGLSDAAKRRILSRSSIKWVRMLKSSKSRSNQTVALYLMQPNGAYSVGFLDGHVRSDIPITMLNRFLKAQGAALVVRPVARRYHGKVPLEMPRY